MAPIFRPAPKTIGFLLNDTERMFRRAFDARSRELGITATQSRVLGYVLRNPGIRQRSLAELIEVEPITLSRMISRLEQSGLIVRSADPTDRRARLLDLTPLAEPLLDELRKTARAVVAEATDGFSTAEREQLTNLVERVRSNLSRRIS